ncbi:unnamed protein product [Bemisia tabaci]|uniref:Cytochrome P450 n=1 Tax=Bemisia tabaci TaxID=7038 RepID=A0A9P0G618_BEMTA|nr:unnamed protein product [Bemisia tabaci]
MDLKQSITIPIGNEQLNSIAASGLSRTTRTLTALLVLCSIIFLVARKWKNRHFEKLAATFPGPTPLPIVGNAMEFLLSDPERIMSKLIELKGRFQSPFRFWLGTKLCVVIAKPADLQIVLNSSKVLEKDDVYRFFRNTVGTGLFSAPVEKWKKTRKAVTPAFNAKLLEQFMPVFNERNIILIEKLKPHCGDGVEFDIWPYISSLALDIICQTALGVKINTQDNENSDFATALMRASELDYLRIYKPWLHPDFIFDRVSYAKELREVYKTLHGLPKEVIQRRKKEFELNKKFIEENNQNMPEKGKQMRVFLDILLELNDQGIQEFTEKDMLDEVVTMMIGGSETSAVTNCFCILLLAMHKEVQDKVFEEQLSIFDGENRPVTVEDLGKMIYTEQVIKETLRMFPAGPVFLRTVKEDTKITGDHVLPAGTTAVIAPLMTHTSPDIWPEPQKFNPDNFTAENLEKKHRYSFIPFSGGPRGCIGSRYAMMSMKTTISTFIRNYEVTTSMKQEDIKLRVDLLIRSVHGWNMKLSPRIYPNSDSQEVLNRQKIE